MKSNRKKIFILTLAIVLVATGAVGFYLFNKGPVNIKKAKAVHIDASVLYKAFETDSATANKKFNGKILQVKGTIKEIGLNQQNQQVILLSTTTEGASINSTMEENIEALQTGKTIMLKGICNGIGESDEDLGLKADVYLTRAYHIE